MGIAFVLFFIKKFFYLNKIDSYFFLYIIAYLITRMDTINYTDDEKIQIKLLKCWIKIGSPTIFVKDWIKLQEHFVNRFGWEGSKVYINKTMDLIENYIKSGEEEEVEEEEEQCVGVEDGKCVGKKMYKTNELDLGMCKHCYNYMEEE